MERQVKYNPTTVIPYEVHTFSPLLQVIGIMINMVLDMTKNFHYFSYGRSVCDVWDGVTNQMSVYPHGCTLLVEIIENFFKYSYVGP